VKPIGGCNQYNFNVDKLACNDLWHAFAKPEVVSRIQALNPVLAKNPSLMNCVLKTLLEKKQ